MKTLHTAACCALYFGYFSHAMAGPITIFEANFDNGVPTQFSGVLTTEAVQGYAGVGFAGNQFGGQFLRNTSDEVLPSTQIFGGNPALPTTLTLTGLMPHTSVTLGFLLGIIDSWDGSTFQSPGFLAPDVFTVTVDNVMIFTHTFANTASFGSQSYVPPAGVGLGIVHRGFNPDWPDGAYDMGGDPSFSNIPHTADTLTIEWLAGGAGWQAGLDESWAIDNVAVSVDATGASVPEPSTMLLIAAGILAFGARRLRAPAQSPQHDRTQLGPV